MLLTGECSVCFGVKPHNLDQCHIYYFMYSMVNKYKAFGFLMFLAIGKSKAVFDVMFKGFLMPFSAATEETKDEFFSKAGIVTFGSGFVD